MRTPYTLALTAALGLSAALAQTTTPPAATPPVTAPTPTSALPATATLGDVVVTGGDDLLNSYLKATLPTRPGVGLSSINLRQVELDAVASGYVVSASAELRVVGGQNVLYVAVKPNPTIGAVTVTGLTFLPADSFKTSIANVLNIAPGAVVNTSRLEQAKDALAENFVQEGYPFLPSISSSTKANADGTVDVNFVVDETAPVSRIEVSGSTLLESATIANAFKPLYDAKKFTPEVYFQGVQAISEAYQAKGVLASGVDVTSAKLTGGVLKVQIVEGKVTGVDVSRLGLDAAKVPTLLTKAGSRPDLAQLEQDVRTLSNASGKSVGFALQPGASPSQVAVVFGVGQDTSAPIKEIRIAGNTAVPTATLSAALRQKVGDVFSRQLSQSDFVALREVYRKAGYEISTRDAVDFKNGVLTYTIREVRIAGYQIKYEGAQRTQARVITRELPAAGTIYRDTTFRKALDTIQQLNLVKISNVSTTAADPANPENLTYVLTVSEQGKSFVFKPEIAYDTLSGLNGTLGIENSNVFGLGHVLGLSAGAAQNDAGQILSANIAYTIPWLDIDFADFRKNRTSVSANAGSSVVGNNGLSDSASGTATATGRQYTTRNTGAGLTVSRAITPFLSGNVSLQTQYSQYYLESLKGTETSSLEDAAAEALLPKPGLSTLTGGGLSYNSTTNANFPTDGLRAGASAYYGFGNSGDTRLSYTRLEGGASTYFGFGRQLDKGFGVKQSQQALALRANSGAVLGTGPSGNTFNLGGSQLNPAQELRGYDAGALKGNNYLSSSVEYRFDLGLSNSVAQGLYLIGFADAATAWGAGTTPFSTGTTGYGAGVGAQLNLGFNGTPITTLRFDYGFSPANPSGKFSFRLGPVW